MLLWQEKWYITKNLSFNGGISTDHSPDIRNKGFLHPSKWSHERGMELHWRPNVMSTLHDRTSLNSCPAKLLWENIKMWFSHHPSTLKCQWLLKFTHKEEKNIHIVHRQYHGWWWAMDARSQGINSHSIDLVCLQYSSVSIRRANTWRTSCDYCILYISKIQNVRASHAQKCFTDWGLLTPFGFINFCLHLIATGNNWCLINAEIY